MKRLLFLLVFISTVLMGSAQVRIQFEQCDRSMEMAISQAVSIDRRDGCVYTAYANPQELAAFEALGIPYEIVPKEGSNSMRKATISAATTIEQMAGWNMYPSYSVYMQMMQNWVAAYPKLCKIDTISPTTTNGHKIICLKISDNVDDEEAEPEFFYMSSMHGDEVTGFYFLLRMIDTLLTSYNVDPTLTNLVNTTQIYICPDANPDGTYHNGDNIIYKPNNTSDLTGRYNGNGIDLNRTYPNPFSNTAYQTQYNNTQQENKDMIQYMNAHHFVMAACMHGGAEILNFPWDSYTSSQRSLADASWWTAMGNRFVATLRQYTGAASNNTFPGNLYRTERIGSGWNPPYTEQCFGGDWYAISGGWQDYSNWYNHIRAFTIEVSRTKCPEISGTQGVKNYWYYQKEPLINLIKEVHEGVHGFVVDSVTREPLRAFIEVVDHDRDSSQIYSRRGLGDYYRPIANGTYSFRASCPGYITKTYTNVTATYGTPTDLLIELVPEGWVPVSYTITVQSEDNAKGTVDGGGVYLGGQYATIGATANTGYEFDHWNDGNTDNPRTFTVTGDATYTAYFTAQTFDITVESEDNAKGTVTGGGEFGYGSTTQISATANEHYTFARWNDNNTDNPRTITVTEDATYTAYFDANNYTITVNPNNGAYGSTSGTGSYAYGSTTQISATPNTGYEFVRWNDNNPENPRTITITGAATYTAVFAPIQYVLTVVSENNAKGTVTGGGTYDYGTNVTISATPTAHHTFAQWNDNNTERTRIVTVTGNATYTAYFNTDTYTVTTASNNNAYGTVSGAGTYEYNTNVTVTANPTTGYEFAHWQDGNTQNPRTFALVQDTNFIATFEAGMFNITVNPNNASYGSTSGTGSYAYGSSVSIGATANEGYHFVEWNDHNTDNPRSVTVSGNVTYTATFAINSYTINISANNASFGSTTGSGTYTHGQTVTTTASPNSGYEFIQWSNGETANPYTFTATQNLTLVAQFAEEHHDPVYYTVTVVSANNAMGSAAGGGVYEEYTPIQISATANNGYGFERWNDNNTDNPRTITVTGDITYTAYFTANSYTITVNPDDVAHGITNGGGTYDFGTTATISATAAEGYHFTQWNDGNTQNPRTVNVTGNATYTAMFALNNYQVVVNPNNAAYGSTTGSGSYNYGTQITISATPNIGYEFTQWNDGNTQNPRTVTVTGNATYTATFTALSYTLTVVPDNNNHGSTTGSGTYTYGATATLTASAAEGYTFQRWNDGNTQATRTVTVMGDAIYTAYFVTNSYQITVTANNPAYGNTTGSGAYSYGEQVSISATASEGHTFSQWDDGNTQNPRTITVTGSATYTAIFTTNAYQLTVVPDETSHGTTTGSGTYDYGTHVSISATAADGYRFRAWNDGNTYPIRTVVVEGNETYTAYFDAIEYQVEVRPNNTICGSTTGSGTYSYMDEVTATATPAAGFVFDHWSDGSTENPYVFNVTHNITLIAVFVSDGSSEEGIDDIETLNYSIYPNPTTGKVNIQSTTVENEPMKLYNLYGQLLQTLPAGSTEVDLSGYAKGTYFLRIGSHSVKLVKM